MLLDALNPLSILYYSFIDYNELISHFRDGKYFVVVGFVHRLQTIFAKFDEVRNSGNMNINSINGEYEISSISNPL